MRINESTFDITVSQYDYGIPLTFETEKDDFMVGDQIVFAFDTDAIPDKAFTVTDSEGFTFDVKLEEEEALAIMPEQICGHIDIAYSIKQYRNGVFLDSLENELENALFNMRVERTVEIGGEAQDIVMLCKRLREENEELIEQLSGVNEDIAEAYTVCAEKGATMPEQQDSAHLARTIESIQSGTGNIDALLEGSIVSLDSNATTLRITALFNCFALQTVNLPLVTNVGESAFDSCQNLENVYLPVAEDIGSRAFYGCQGLREITLPAARIIRSSAFEGCLYVEKIVLNSATHIEGNVFTNTFSYVPIQPVLILGARAEVPFFVSDLGIDSSVYVYVQPGDMEWYSTARYWRTLYNNGQIKSIEELPEGGA